MSYSSLMRNAARLLFGLAVVLFVGTVVASVVFANSMNSPAAVLAGLAGAFSSAVVPFLGAAIIWRLDIWLFERSGD